MTERCTSRLSKFPQSLVFMTEFGRLAMEAKALHIKLPVTDLEQTRRFWSEPGFSFNAQFSDEKACCLVVRENLLYAMLIKPPYFANFTNKPVHNRLLVQLEVRDLSIFNEASHLGSLLSFENNHVHTGSQVSNG